MGWVETIWLLMIGASLTLGAIHLVVWFRQRREYFHFLFFALAFSAATYGGFELAMMTAASAREYSTLLRWAHVPIAAFVVATIGFVRVYFGAGHAWLAFAAVGLRLLALWLNFTTGENLNFLHVESLDHTLLLGGPVGTVNPWAVVAQISNLLVLAFVVDASIALWRRGGRAGRRRAALVGGSLILCIIAAAGSAALTTLGVLHLPTFMTPSVFLVVLAMGYDIGSDVVAAARLGTRLAASEASLRAVVEAMPNAVLLVDARGAITLVNAPAERFFGYTRQELIGQPVEMLLPERVQAEHVRHRDLYAAAAQPRAMGAGRDLSGRHRSGSEFPIEVGLSPLQIEGQPCVLVSISDITARREMERAAALQRDELAHLSRLAMLGELSGSLAHELNQPLTAILSNAQAGQRFLARNPPNLEQVGEILADIVKSDRRAGLVIQRLRSMLRKEPTQREPLDLNDLVLDSLALMRNELMNRRVEVDVALGDQVPLVTGDRIQLQQVLLNLVTNGCDAMAAAAADQRLTVTTRCNGSGAVELCVSDRGCGIPDADLERIFDAFVTTKPNGMGLGLAICRTIVEAHDGRLRAANNAQGGASFHVELPPAGSKQEFRPLGG